MEIAKEFIGQYGYFAIYGLLALVSSACPFQMR